MPLINDLYKLLNKEERAKLKELMLSTNYGSGYKSYASAFPNPLDINIRTHDKITWTKQEDPTVFTSTTNKSKTMDETIFDATMSLSIKLSEELATTKKKIKILEEENRNLVEMLKEATRE